MDVMWACIETAVFLFQHIGNGSREIATHPLGKTGFDDF